MTKQITALLTTQKEQIAKALPKHVDAGRMVRVALTELRVNPKLTQCDPLSFLGAVIKCAQLGLEIGAGLGQAYLIPFGKEVQVVVGYQGLMDLALRSGKVDSIIADCVYRDDDFDFYTDMKGQHIHHKPNLKSARDEHDILIVYAMAQIKDGGSVIAWMTKTEIDTHETKNRKGKFKGTTWKDHWSEMAKKTVIRRLYKYLPKSIEMRDIVTNESLADSGISQDSQSIITLEPAIEQIEEPQPKGRSAEEIAALQARFDELEKNADTAEEKLKNGNGK